MNSLHEKSGFICILVMLVSMIPAFAATTDTPLKTQDCTCIGTQKKDQNRTKDQTELRIKKELNHNWKMIRAIKLN